MPSYIGQSGSFSLMKNLNLDKVYRTIVLNQPISRADISRLTGLNKVTVSNCVKDLLAIDLVSEEGTVTADNGRPPVMLELSETFGVIVGIEISGISTNIMFTDLRGNLLDKTIREAKPYSPDELVAYIEKIVEEYKHNKSFTRGVVGVGVALPLNYNQLDTVEKNAPLPEWKGVDADKLLKEHFKDLPIEVLNTAAAGTIGEIHFGSSNPDTYLVYLHGNWTLKLDVYEGGETYSSHSSFSGKLGQILIADKNEAGNMLALDDLCSIKSLVSELYPNTKMTRLEAVDDLHERQKNGDKEVDEKLRAMIDYLALGLYNVLQLFRPECICIGGYLGMTLSNGYVDLLNEKLDEIVGPENNKGRRVVCSEFGIFNVGFGCVSWIRDKMISYYFGEE